jgi:hypothetical protein
MSEYFLHVYYDRDDRMRGMMMWWMSARPEQHRECYAAPAVTAAWQMPCR